MHHFRWAICYLLIFEAFERYNWKGNKEDLLQSFDDCVTSDRPECMETLQVLTHYFCGVDDKCNMKGQAPKAGTDSWGGLNDWDKVAKAAESAKSNILTEYYVIGILGISLFVKVYHVF